jgi:hypothetical protein
MNTQMKILNIFHFQTGETIFAGKLSEEIPIIRIKTKYVADLIVDDQIYQQNIKINGEMVADRNPHGYRAMITMEKIEINSDFVKNHDCQLVLIEVEVL